MDVMLFDICVLRYVGLIKFWKVNVPSLLQSLPREAGQANKLKIKEALNNK